MKHQVKLILRLLLLTIIGYGVYKVVVSYSNKKEIEVNIQELPNGQFISLSNEVVNLHDYKGKPILIIYFHPECEHCQYEAQALRLNREALINTQLLMITNDNSFEQVNLFAENYKLWDLEAIDILIDKRDVFYKTFGTSMVPSVFIYDSKRQLQNKYLGETKPEAIMASLP